MTDIPVIVDGIRLMNVHQPGVCEGRPCVIHRPSLHGMRGWRLHWRGDRGIFERLCPECGCGHPDPDQYHYWRETNQEWQMVHGCCSHAWDICGKEAE